MAKVRGMAASAASLAAFLAAIVLAIDPWGLSIISKDPSFQAKPIRFGAGDWRRWSAAEAEAEELDLGRRQEVEEGNGRRWELPEGVQGPESLAMDPRGKGPYTGVADGRVLVWDSDIRRWIYFAHTSPYNRSTLMCESDGQTMMDLARKEHLCGRPLGLRFNQETGDLYIADAYFGLLSVGPNGGQAKQLVTEVDGVPLTFTNDLDIASDGSIYFADSSSKYERRNFFLLVLSGDDSGRVLKYDPKSGKTSVLVRGLQFPNGVALSKDESFLVIAESIPGRLLRHWLKGVRAGKTEVMTVLPGYPDNVRRNPAGDFWVAMHCRRNSVSSFFGVFPLLRHAFLRLPIPFRFVYRLFNGGPPHGIVAKVDSLHGHVSSILEDPRGLLVKYASEVDERDDGRLWIASVLLPYIAVYDLPSAQPQS